MKDKLGPVSKKDLIFISVILAVLIVMVVFDTSVDILANFDEEMLQVTSPRLNMDIPHSDVVSVRLMDMPELGELVDGYAHNAYCTGSWKNDIWDEYDLCVIPTLPRCIAVELVSGRTMVFTCSTEAKTVELFEAYSTYLNP